MRAPTSALERARSGSRRQQLVAAGQRAPRPRDRRWRPARRGWTTSDSTPGLERLPEVIGSGRLALEEGGEPVPHARDGGLDLAEELARADELLPPREHLAPQQGAVHHPRRAPGRSASAYAAAAAPTSASPAAACSDPAATQRRERASSETRAPSSVWRTTSARAWASPASAPSQPRSRSTCSSGSSPSTSSDSRTVKIGACVEPLLAQHRREVRADLVDGGRRDAVEHDGDGGAALATPRAAAPTAPRRRSGRPS